MLLERYLLGLTIGGMTCLDWSRHVTTALQRVVGGQPAHVECEAGRGHVDLGPGVTPTPALTGALTHALVAAVERAGYRAGPLVSPEVGAEASAGDGVAPGGSATAGYGGREPAPAVPAGGGASGPMTAGAAGGGRGGTAHPTVSPAPDYRAWDKNDAPAPSGRPARGSPTVLCYRLLDLSPRPGKSTAARRHFPATCTGVGVPAASRC